GVIDDEVAPQVRCDDQRRDPRAGPESVVNARGPALSRRRDVVPLAAELVVRDDDHGVLGASAVLDVREQADQVVAARALARVSGVLVLLADWLDEANRLQVAGAGRALGRGDELRLVAQVLRTRGRARRVVEVVVERLVVVLE